MRCKEKKRIADYYNRISRIYDAQYGEEQNRKIIAALDSIRIRRGDIILDVGCGTGILFDHIKESGITLVGLDISLGLLKKAASKARFYSSVHLVRADFDSLPFQQETFSKIFSVTVLQNALSPQRSLREIRRVANKNCSIIVTGLKKKFSQEDLLRLFQKTNLEANSVEDTVLLKDHLFLCRKIGKAA